jgi:hypothetical protein
MYQPKSFLSADRGFTYSDLYALLGNEETIAWLTPHAVVGREGGRVERYRHGAAYGKLAFSADDKSISAVAQSPEHLLEICNVVLRLLAPSVVHSVVLDKWGFPDSTLINAPSLAHLMEQCQSLKCLKLEDLALDGNHCRVFGNYSRPGLEIVLEHCRF